MRKVRTSDLESQTMPTLHFRSEMPVPQKELFDWHSREGAFERLAPPWQNIQVVEREGTITNGSKLVMELRPAPGLRVRWHAHHKHYIEGQQFVDEQVKGPFARWEHTHRFIPGENGGSILDDHIEYKLPLHPISQIAGGWLAKGQFERMFRFRHARTRDDLLRHHQYIEQPRQTIAITGSSGLIGTALSAFLTTGGHSVRRMVRRPVRETDEIYWQPATGEIDADALQNVDTVIHLAGENVGAGRWTKKRKEAIMQSREQGTRLLSTTLANMSNPPRTLLVISAVGIYGDRGDEILTEESSAGEGFLAEVVKAWEAAVAPAVEAGIRVVLLRTGVVMSAQGGALAKLLLPFSLGVGGKIGSGKQYMSWVALDDVLGAFYHAMFDESLSGVVNLTSPQPVTNAEFARTLGRVLGRPTIIPLPGGAIKLAFGQMGQETILEGNRVLPQRLQNSDFEFLYPNLENALRLELGRLKTQ